MEILNTAVFYILVLICTFGAAFCLFKKDTINSIIGAALVFFGFSGFYFLLNAPYSGTVQILLAAAVIAVLMLFSIMATNSKKDKKNTAVFSLKTLLTPFLAVIFAFLTVPFILYQFKGYKVLESYSLAEFALNLYKNNALAFELIGILIFASIAGIAAVIVIKNSKKPAQSADIQNQKGEKA